MLKVTRHRHDDEELERDMDTKNFNRQRDTTLILPVV